MLCGDLNGKEIQKRGDIGICIADSLCCTVETNRTLKSNYIPIKLISIRVCLLYNVVSVSAVQQSESTIHIHISPLFWISLPFRSPHSTE